jgi:hypothetical protein
MAAPALTSLVRTVAKWQIAHHYSRQPYRRWPTIGRLLRADAFREDVRTLEAAGDPTDALKFVSKLSQRMNPNNVKSADRLWVTRAGLWIEGCRCIFMISVQETVRLVAPWATLSCFCFEFYPSRLKAHSRDAPL